MVVLKAKIFRVLKDIIVRRHIREINFYYATITMKECFLLAAQLLKSYLGKENIINGGFISRFEEEFAKYIGVDSAFSFGSGRMAFYAILKAMGIKGGDEIILPAYTCAVIPNAIIYCGAKPVYVDIDPKTFNMDVSKIEEKITFNTRAVIVQHMFGLPADMDKLITIAERYNLRIIEDCAQALGAEYKNKKVGSFGDAAFFSFEVSKVITTGWGGMAVTSDTLIQKALAEEQEGTGFLGLIRTRKLTIQIILSYFLYHPWNYWLGKYLLAILYKQRIFIPSITEEERQGQKPANYPCRLSNIQAVLGLSQLQKLRYYIQDYRVMVAKRYAEMFKDIEIPVNKEDTNVYKHIYLRYTFLVDNRKKAIDFFRNYQIELGEWFNQIIVCTDLPLEKLNYRKGSCPNAEWVAGHSVNLFTHPRLSSKDIARIIKVTKVFLLDKNKLWSNG